jgi:uncharacterized protein with PIN domain
MKFLCDQMLGSLAKWLRIFGFDTFYANADITDNELLDLAKQESRVLLSRDKIIVTRAGKKSIKSVYVESTNLDEQLKMISKLFAINTHEVLSRCIICNSLLMLLKKVDVHQNVPKKIYNSQDTFWYCQNCNKYYWMGTHYDAMIEKVKKFIK